MNVKRGMAGLAALFFALHLDIWFWKNPNLVLGLPIGLVYHIGLCFALSFTLFLVVRKSEL